MGFTTGTDLRPALPGQAEDAVAGIQPVAESEIQGDVEQQQEQQRRRPDPEQEAPQGMPRQPRRGNDMAMDTFGHSAQAEHGAMLRRKPAGRNAAATGFTPGRAGRKLRRTAMMTDPFPGRSTFSTASEMWWTFTAADCREPAIGWLYDYWLAKKGGHRFPARQDIDPLEMKVALGGISLFDVERDPLRFRYRLIGADIVQRDGFDLTGRYLDELPLEQYRALIEGRLRLIMQNPAPLLVHNKQFYDQRWFDYEAIWLPLASDHVTVDILMACQIFADTPTDHVGPPVVRAAAP